MDGAKMLLGTAMVLATLFFLVIFGTLFGGLVGWLVGIVFGDTILYVAGQLGIHGVACWQLGMFLGFVGGFFKSTTTVSKGN